MELRLNKLLIFISCQNLILLLKYVKTQNQVSNIWKMLEVFLTLLF